MTPKAAAQTDWALIGEFMPEKYQGTEREEYEKEAARIQEQWDNQPE